MREFVFDPELFEFRRVRNSTTQGAIAVYYDGIYIETFGDDVQLMENGTWEGRPNSYFMEGAKRELRKKLQRFIDSI